MQKIPVSVVIAACNEEAFIEDCLKSVQWAEEIVVVDGGSTDLTQEIAGRYGAVVIATQNAPAEVQRLKGLKQIHFPWFLILDADERADPQLRDSVLKVLSDPAAKNSYKVLRRNYYKGKAVHLHHPDFQIRFFRTGEAASLPDKIHRLPQPAGPIGILQGEIEHLFFTDWTLYQKKFDFYTGLEAQYFLDAGKRLHPAEACFRLWFRPLARFFQYYFLRNGILDELFGLKYCWKSGCYERAVVVKILRAQSASCSTASLSSEQSSKSHKG